MLTTIHYPLAEAVEQAVGVLLARQAEQPLRLFTWFCPSNW
jgi:DNA-binding LacI/PurR family transcriptional regulator